MSDRTPQEKAFFEMRDRFGRSGFTEDHINYRRVGYRLNGRVIAAIGSTWDDAIALLKESN